MCLTGFNGSSIHGHNGDEDGGDDVDDRPDKIHLDGARQLRGLPA